MKQNDEHIINNLKNELNKLDSHPLPKKLQKDEIAKMLKAKEESGEISAIKKQQKRQNQQRFFKAFASVAAVLIVLFGSVKAFNTGMVYLNQKSETRQDENDKTAEGEKNQNAKPLPEYIKTPNSHEDIEKIFVSMSKKARKPSLGGMFGGIKNEAAIDENFEADADDSGERKHGETNLQVDGVDEADSIKNDGTYIYKIFYKNAEERKREIISSGAAEDSIDRDYIGDLSGIQIIKAYPAEDMKIMSSTLINGTKALKNLKGLEQLDSNIVEFYLQNNTLYIILNEYAYAKADNDYTYKNLTSVLIYDVSNKAEPKLQKSFSQEGSYLSSRITNNRLVVLSKHNIGLHNSLDIVKKSCVPKFYINENEEKINPNDILMIDGIESSEYLILSNINLKNTDEKPNYKAVLGGATDAYCTKDTLYVPNVIYDYSNNTAFWGRMEIVADIFIQPSSSFTDVFCFDIREGIDFKSSGRVPGQPLNQFAMDEYKDYFRIATTDTKDNTTSNNIYVLDKDFKIVGKVEGLAKGESIQSVRFMGDTAYVVTFFRTDPLFVIDMTEAANPKVLGELKIPGFSQYLHLVGDGLLLGVGVSGDDEGQTDGVKISLFDVKNPKQPKEVSKLEIPHVYTPNISHKAFLSVTEKNLYAIPIKSYGTYANASSLYSFKLEGNTLKPHKAYQQESTNPHFYSPYERGTYIEDIVYYVTGYETLAFSMDSGELINKIK